MPTVVDCTQLSNSSCGGRHLGSDPGFGAEEEKNTAANAPADMSFMKSRATLTLPLPLTLLGRTVCNTRTRTMELGASYTTLCADRVEEHPFLPHRSTKQLWGTPIAMLP